MPGWNQSLWFSVLASLAFKSTVLLGAAWLIALLLRRRSAAARHLVWTAVAAAVLAMPLLSVSLPALHLPASAAFFPLNTGLVFRVTGWASADVSPGTAAAEAAAVQPSRPAPWRPDVKVVVVLVWAAGTLALWSQMALAYAAMRRVHRRARMLGVYRGVTILEAESGSMPMAFGLRKPAIFLPADAAGWTEERRQMVLIHELAHVRRGDVATHLVARAALALNWWNPLAWTAWREFLKEGERAADDLVLNAGARASEYAGHLLEVARSMQSARPLAWAAVAMARRSQMEGRLLAILDPGVNRKQAGRAALVAALFLAIVLAAPFAAMRAQNPLTQPPPEIDATIRAAMVQKNHEILERAAAAYENLQKYEVAQTLLESALVIRGQVSGQQSADYAAGLVKLGDLSLKRRNFGDAEGFYAKAISLGDWPEVTPALLYLGRAAYSKHDPKAADLLQRAVNAAGSGPVAGPAMTWLAMARQGTPDGVAEAESLYQRALSMEDPNSSDAATTMELYARFLRLQDRAPEAVTMESRANGIRQANIKEMMQNMALPSDVFRVGGGVSAPRLVQKVEPQYTQEARAAKLAGTVLVYVEIGPDGLAHNARILKGIGLGLDEKAVEAISQWQFQPGTKDGQPVTVAATIEVNFRLL